MIRIVSALLLVLSLATAPGCALFGSKAPAAQTIESLDRDVTNLRKKQESLKKKYDVATGTKREKLATELEKTGALLGNTQIKLEAKREIRDLDALLADARKKLLTAGEDEKPRLEAKISDYEQRRTAANLKLEDTVAPVAKKDYDVAVEGAKFATFTMPTKFEHGVGLGAVLTNGNVAVSVRNESASHITMIWRDLAMITGPDPKRDLMFINPDTANVREIPYVDLAPGQQTSFVIPLKVTVAGRKLRLVYNNPREKILFMVPVE